MTTLDIHVPSNALYASIVGTVAATPAGLTARQIAERLDVPVDTVRHCVALHRFLRERRGGVDEDAALMLPGDELAVPDSDDAIDHRALGL